MSGYNLPPGVSQSRLDQELDDDLGDAIEDEPAEHCDYCERQLTTATGCVITRAGKQVCVECYNQPFEDYDYKRDYDRDMEERTKSSSESDGDAKG